MRGTGGGSGACQGALPPSLRLSPRIFKTKDGAVWGYLSLVVKYPGVSELVSRGAAPLPQFRPYLVSLEAMASPSTIAVNASDCSIRAVGQAAVTAVSTRRIRLDPPTRMAMSICCGVRAPFIRVW